MINAEQKARIKLLRLDETNRRKKAERQKRLRNRTEEGASQRLKQELAKALKKTAAETEAKRIASERAAAAELATLEARKIPTVATEVARFFNWPTILAPASKYVITAAQNNTPVHAKFFASLRTYCKHNRARLVVIPYRYRNPTSRDEDKKREDMTWAEELHPFLFAGAAQLNENIVVDAYFRMSPTRADPISALRRIPGGTSAIAGHGKLQLASVPGLDHAKLLSTTGAVTQKDHSDTTMGQIADFHQTLSAVVVEIQNTKLFHLRQLNADAKTGEFIDLDTLYTPRQALRAPPALALVLGDAHVDFIDPAVVEATFGNGGICKLLEPRHIIWHDLNDGYAVNPHHRGNPFNTIAKVKNNRADARAEMLRAFEFVKAHTPAGAKSVVVSSNHDDFLTRWIISQDWREAPANAEFYLETALAMVRNTTFGTSGTKYPDVVSLWGRKILQDVRFLDRDESMTLGGIELGLHGDVGPNGARGSAKNLRGIGVKSIIGHAHSPKIEDGCYQTGTSTALRLEYNRGPSGWLNTHCVLYANGKRSLINIIDGNWRVKT